MSTDDQIIKALYLDTCRREVERDWAGPAPSALERGLAEERAALQTPMLSLSTADQPAQAAYVRGLVLRKTIADKAVQLAPIFAHHAAAPVNQQLTTEPVTPERIRAAFERAGVNMIQGLDEDSQWGAPDKDWTGYAGHRLRPAPGTPPHVISRFYWQFDAVEILAGCGNWLRRDPVRTYSLGAGCYRLPADAKLVRPL